MPPKDPGPSSDGPSASTSQVNTARLDNYVPTFNNVQKDYREFRKRCEIYKKKMELGNRGSEVVYNIVTLLQGKAWDLVEDLSLDQLGRSDAYEVVFERLDRGFQFDPLTELPDDFEQFFVRLVRKQGQTLQDYMTEYTKVERRLKSTHGIELPDKVRAWWFLRRSGITKEQRQLVLTNVGTAGLTLTEVQKAMSFILGQDSKVEQSSGRWNRAKSDVFYNNEDDAGYDWADTEDVNYDNAMFGDEDDFEVLG